MDWGTIGLIISLGIVGFVYYKMKNKEKTTQEEPETVQDLFKYKTIDDDGLIELHNGTYSVVIEVQPINIKMQSQHERDGVWFNFRTFLNTLPIHATFLVQSQYVDMSEYVEDYVETSQQVPLTPQLQQTAMGVADHLRTFSEKKTRDFNSFIILRFNPYSHGTEAGISTGNSTLDGLFQNIRGEASQMSHAEAKELAENMLDEVSELVHQSFDGLGTKVVRLDKIGVFHMIHQTMNRDLAPYQQIHDVYHSGGFTANKQSLTPVISESQHDDMDYYEKGEMNA